MVYLADAVQMKSIDQCAMEEYEIPSMVLMERAALAFSNVLMEREAASRQILIIYGSGNNGGDGLAAGRILSENGYQVSLLGVGSAEHASEQLRQQSAIVRKMKLPMVRFSKEEASSNEAVETAKTMIASADVIVDAIFGVGLNREITGHYRDVINWVNESQAVKYAMDIPSGIHAGTGHILQCAVKADVTVTFGVGKKGLVLYPGANYAGEVIIKDVGFPGQAVKREAIRWKLLEKSDLYGLLERKRHSNKGTYGRVLVIAGSRTMSGAAYFSAMAAYRMGVGLVKIVSEVHNEGVLRTLLPEALFSFYDETTEIEELLEKELSWADAVVVGPGLSLSDTAVSIVRNVLTMSRCPCVVDADAITILAGFSKEEQKESLGKENLVFTPHVKEMAVLLGKDVSYVAQNLYRLPALLPELRGILVCKDAATITTGGEETYVNTLGTNGLATGGSGDILTGVFAGIYAQRKDAWKENFLYDTARGVSFHGLCGTYAARRKSESSMLSRDTLDSISEAAKEIMSKQE